MTLKSKLAKKATGSKKASKPAAKKTTKVSKPAPKPKSAEPKPTKEMDCTCRAVKIEKGMPLVQDGFIHRIGANCEQVKPEPPAPKAESVAATPVVSTATAAESTASAVPATDAAAVEGAGKRSRRTKAQLAADMLAQAHATLAANGMVAVSKEQWEQFQHDEEFLDKAAGMPHVPPTPVAATPTPHTAIPARIVDVCGFPIPEHRHPSLPADVPYVLDDPKFKDAGVAAELAGVLAKWIDAKKKIKELEGLRDAWAEDAQVLMAVADAEVVGIDCYKVQIIPPDTYPHISIDKLRDLVPTSILEQATEQKPRKSYMRFDDMRKKEE